MKAIITTAYGDPDVLKYEETDDPRIMPNEILVGVKHSCVNPLDWKIRRGDMKIMSGRKAPKILGTDYSGVVYAVGSSIKEYKRGDKVFGLVKYNGRQDGTYAELLRVTKEEISKKPKSISFEQAAALPMVTVTAYQSLITIAKLKSGQNVYITGSTGGVGSIAVQIAKSFHCTVTGVCSTKNIKLAKKLGVDEVLDYKNDDLLKNKSKYDIIFDTSGTLPYSQAKQLLKPAGVYVTTNVTMGAMLFGGLLNVFRSKKANIVMAKPDPKQMDKIKDLIEAGKIKAKISKVFPLNKIADAHEMSEKGGYSGKIVIKVQ